MQVQLSHITIQLRMCALVLCIFMISCGSEDSEATAQNDPEPTVPTDVQSTVLGHKDIAVEEFDKLRANEGIVVIDVRTPAETAEGMVPGAIEIDFNGEGFEAAIKELNRSTQYLVYCRSGGRSEHASKLMTELGFTDVYNLLGGYNGWSEAHQLDENN